MRIRRQPTHRPTVRRLSRNSEASSWWSLADVVEIKALPLESDWYLGVVVAERHPTGWFISAWVQPGLTAQHLEQFKEFARVRIYLLLAGHQAGVWVRAGSAREWHAYAGLDLIAPVSAIPDCLPARWT